jgi:hypothetical protein
MTTKETWQNGTLVKREMMPDLPPDPRTEVVAGLVADIDKAGSIADLKGIVKKILSLMACILLVSVMGCGMFGDTRLYTGILNLCAKCHADNPTAPAGMDNLKRSAPGAEGVGGTSAKCKFTMDHWTR